MGPDYTVVPTHEHYMYHVARQQPHETTCYACGRRLPGELRWSEVNQRHMFGAMLVGPYVAVITDRSGSEQATAHNNEDCIEVACEELDRYYYGDPYDDGDPNTILGGQQHDTQSST